MQEFCYTKYMAEFDFTGYEPDRSGFSILSESQAFFIGRLLDVVQKRDHFTDRYNEFFMANKDSSIENPGFMFPDQAWKLVNKAVYSSWRDCIMEGLLPEADWAVGRKVEDGTPG